MYNTYVFMQRVRVVSNSLIYVTGVRENNTGAHRTDLRDGRAITGLWVKQIKKTSAAHKHNKEVNSSHKL